MNGEYENCLNISSEALRWAVRKGTQGPVTSPQVCREGQKVLGERTSMLLIAPAIRLEIQHVARK
jgi:orotidine-5'-phosphate decarboxylase